MEAHARSPRALFEGKEHYEIPAFQRPYVWNEEDQWAPLWDDVTRVAEGLAKATEAGTDPSTPHHFLGAVVYVSKKPVAGDVTRHDVIDGQQRMTTLQLLIDAVQQVIAERGHDIQAEALEDLVLNRQTAFKGKRERFKLWPSQADRNAFAHAMAGAGAWTGEHRIVEAHHFFGREAERWLTGKPDDDDQVPPGTEEARVEALSSVLQDGLQLVAIDLTGHDDAQLIFETLNDRGTPLLKADLIKNWVFRRGEQMGNDVDEWSRTHWADFDGVWWREEITQGRLSRSRVDIFMQYWLTMRRLDEVKVENIFRVFTGYAEPLMSDAAGAEALLSALRKDADTYRNLAQLDETTPEGRFHSRVIETMELAATTPLFLLLLSTNYAVPTGQRKIGLQAIESWVIRRTLLRQTTKDVNRFMVAVLKALEGVDPAEAGDRIYAYLSEQTAEARFWPSDGQMTTRLPDQRVYGNIRQGRLRVVLGAVEQHLRSLSSMYEAVQLPAALEIEHVMPQGWRSHWDPQPKLSLEAASDRDRLVNTIGNLTLVTKSLNGSLSNRPWTDDAAAGLVEGGEAGKGKRTLLNAFSLLVMNKEILDDHVEAWNENDVGERSLALAHAVNKVWPGPSEEIQNAAYAAAAAAASTPSDLPEIEWTGADIERLASEAGETLTIVLDTLATHPGEQWSNANFVAAGLATHAFAAVGALTMKVRGGFGRSNSPVQSHQSSSHAWTWSLPDDVAAMWCATRGIT